MKTSALNRVDAQAVADRNEDALAAAYLRVLQAAGRKAAQRFRGMAPLAMTAADAPVSGDPPNWTPPDIDELVDLGLIAEQTARQTASLHVKTLAQVLDAYGRVIRQVTVPVVGAPSFDVTNPLALTLLSDIGGRSGDVAKSIRDDLQKIIGDAYTRGLSVLDAAAIIQERTDEFSQAQARMLARTDLNGIANGGSVIAAKAVGVQYKTWLTASDDLVRPTHQDANDQTVPIDQPFDVGGESADYPGDPQLSDAEACNCRCTVIYTDNLDGEESETASAGPDTSSLAMIAVYPAAAEADAIAIEGAQPAEKLHVTLVFLGEADSFDHDAAREALAEVAAEFPALSGQVGGVGRFASGPDGAPLIALPDVRGLSAIREAVAAALVARGIASPSEHGWLPHMTLDYVEGNEAPPPEAIGKQLTFASLSFAVADVRQDIPLTGDLQAAATGATIGGTMKPAQITIPLTFSIGTASTGVPTTMEDAIRARSESRRPGGLDLSGTSITLDQRPFAVLDPSAGRRWRAVLCVEGEPTEDGRLLETGSISWRELPLSLMAQTETQPGHDGAEVCGRVDRIWREGTRIMGEGVFDSGTFGTEIARLVSDQTLRGLSVDLAVLDYERRPMPGAPEPAEDEMPAEMFVVTEGVIGAATVCSFQAIAEATIEVLTSAAGFRMIRVTQPFAPERFADDPETVVASAAPLYPPADWFENPGLDRPTMLTVTDDGRVFGHVAPWKGCHAGYLGRCVPPPRSRTGYGHFHVGRVKTDDGALVEVGRLTLAAGHADTQGLTLEQARAHYDNSATVAAFVRAGEDEHGIWVAGVLRHDVPPAMVQDLLANPLSGDWRNGEMVAAHAVPLPGFPILQASAIGPDGGEETALIITSTIGLPEPPDLALRSRVLAARARGGIDGLAALAHA